MLSQLDDGLFSMSGYFPLQVDVDYLLKKLSHLEGKPVAFAKYAMASIGNNMTMLLYGKRYHYEDKNLIELQEALAKVGRTLATGPLVICVPQWAYKLSVLLPFTRMHAAKVAMQQLMELVRCAGIFS